MPTLAFYDVCCGAGGLTLGLKRVGFQHLGGLDNDRFAVEAYRKNHDRGDFADLLNTKLETVLEKAFEDADLNAIIGVVGGIPCQPYSSVNQRRPKQEHPTYPLVDIYLRTIDKMRPTWFLMENVMTIQNDARLPMYKTKLNKAYWIWDGIQDLGEFGLPQYRKRYLLVGIRRDQGRAFRLGQTEGRKPLRDAIYDLERLGSDLRYKQPTLHRAHPFPQDWLKVFEKIEPGEYLRPDHIDEEFKRKYTRLTQFAVERDSHSIWKRLKWNEPCPPLTTRFHKLDGYPSYLHPEEHRGLTFLEGARIQGFPDDYFIENHSDFSLATQIGNAFPPPAAEFIGKHLLRCFER